jgi:hypothetical protein
MGHPRPWVPLVLYAAIALALWWFVPSLVGGVRIGTCLAPVEGPHAGQTVCGFDNGAGLGPHVAGFLVGAAVILAVTYAARLHAARIDLVAVIAWTAVFWVVANATPLDVACPSPGDPSNAYCYVPWTPGLPRMAVWALVSVGILVLGFLARRVRLIRSTPVGT